MSAGNELFIYLRLVSDQATQSSQRYHQGERQRINQTAQAQDQADKKRLSNARLNDQAFKQLTKQALADAKITENAEKVQAESRKKAANDVAKARIKSEKETADARKQINRDVNQLLKQYEREETQSARQTSSEKIKATRESTRAEMQDLRNKHQLAMLNWTLDQKAARAATEVQHESAAATRAASSQMVAFGSTVLGLSGGLAVLSSFKDAWKGVADEAARAAAAAADFQKESRVSGTLTGKTAAQVSPEILGIMRDSGLERGEADNMYRQFYGSLPAGLQKGNITPDVAKDLLTQTAITAARQGGDAGVKGDLAGILPMFEKIDSAEAGMGKLEAIRMALTEGRGDDTPLTRSLLNVSGTMVREGGPVGSLPEMAALIGTTSLSAGPAMADTRALQVMRAARGTDKKQMANIESQFGIKAGSKMGLEERLDKMVPKLREVAKTQDVQSWLTMNVGTPQEDAQALVEVMGNYEVLKQRFAAARASSSSGPEVKAENTKFLGSTLGQQMVAKSKAQAGEYMVGNKTQDAQSLIEMVKANQAAEPPSLKKNIPRVLRKSHQSRRVGTCRDDCERHAQGPSGKTQTLWQTSTRMGGRCTDRRHSREDRRASRERTRPIPESRGDHQVGYRRAAEQAHQAPGTTNRGSEEADGTAQKEGRFFGAPRNASRPPRIRRCWKAILTMPIFSNIDEIGRWLHSVVADFNFDRPGIEARSADRQQVAEVSWPENSEPYKSRKNRLYGTEKNNYITGQMLSHASLTANMGLRS